LSVSIVTLQVAVEFGKELRGFVIRIDAVAHRSYQLRRNLPERDLIVGTAAFTLDLHEPCLDLRESRLFSSDPAGKVFAFAVERLAHLFNGHAFLQQQRDLDQRESQLLEDQYAIEAGQQIRRVVTVSRSAIHESRFEQPNLIIEAKGLDRDLTQSGKISDSEHLSSFIRKEPFSCSRPQSTVSRNWRVKRSLTADANHSRSPPGGGKNSERSLRYRRLCGELFFGQIHRRTAGHAKITQRKLFFLQTPLRVTLCREHTSLQ